MKPAGRSNQQELGWLAGIGAAYFVALELVFYLPATDNPFMAIWPVGGVGLAAFLLSPRHRWPGLVAVLFATGTAANLISGRPWSESLGFMTANVLESFGSAMLISRWCGEQVRFTRVREILALLAAVGAVNGGTALVGAGTSAVVAGKPFWPSWQTWWIADGLGILVITPLIVTWAEFSWSLVAGRRWTHRIETAAFLILWCAAGWLAFRAHGKVAHLSPEPYVLIAIMAWAALRLGLRGVTAAVVLMAAILLPSDAVVNGPLLWGGANLTERLMLAEAYLGVMAGTGLLLAASSTEARHAHAALTALGVRNRTLLATAGDGIHVLDASGRVVEANGAFCRMLGYAPEELLRLSVTDFDAQFSAAELRAKLDRLHDHPAMFETTHRRKDGTRRSVEINAVGVTLDGRRHIYASARDITERKRVETALRVSEERYQRVERAVDDGVWDWDIVARQAYLSPRWKAILGYEDGEMSNLGTSFFERIHPDDQAAAGEAVQWHLAEGVRFAVELRLRGKDGEYRWVYAWGEVIRDDAGRPVRMLGSITDIHERKLTEESLRLSEERFAKVFHCAPVWIAITDLADATYVDVNGQALRDSGFSRAEVIGRTSVELGWIAAGDCARIVQEFQDHGRIAGLEMTFHAKDGRILHGWMSGEKILVGGRACMLTIAIDLTARRLAEESVRESERMLRESQQVAALGSYVLDIPTCQWRSSAILDELFGIDATFDRSLAGWSSLVAESDRPALLNYFTTEVLGQGAPFDREYRIVRPSDGAERWVHGIGKLERDAAGQPVRMFGTIQDITERKRAEAALRQSEERYRTLVELSPEAVFVQVEGRIVFANQAAANLVGAGSVDAWLGTKVMDLVDPEYHEIVKERMRKLDVEGTGQPLARIRWRRCDGGPIEVMVVAKPVRFNEQPATLVIALDVTAQRQTEAELRKLSRAVEQSPVTVVITDAAGAIEYVNPSFTAKTGYTLAEARGLNPRLLNSGELSPEVYRDLWATIGAGREWRGEFHNKKKNGELFWEAATISPITDDAGNITHFLAVKEDITEQKAAEDRIREQAALLDVTHDAIIVLSLDGLVAFWNRGAEKLYGVGREQARSRRYATIAYRDLPSTYEADWRQFLERGEWSVEQRQVNGARDDITVQLRAVLVRDEQGCGKSALLVISDISEAKRLEAQFLRAQRLESLGSLASGVAHDLNNVLAPIMMAVELLRPLAQAERDHDMLQLLSDSTRRGADIVQQLLLFGRGSDSPRAPTNVAGVIKDVGKMMRQTFPKNLVLSLQAPADLWLIEADRTQIHQVVLNLCVNARDAMPQGGRLTVLAENVRVDEALARSHGSDRTGAFVRVLVKDTGTGIAAAHLEKIFDPFFTTKPIGEGTGLGLATVLGIVRSHGGFVAVNSREGAGAEFEIYLPAAGAEAEAAGDKGDGPALEGRGECVLIVDDEEVIRSVLQQVLTARNYRVLVAADGAEALGVFAQNAAKVQLVVTDVMMPVMDGTQLLTALRRLNPGMPAVAISGLASHRAEFEKKFGPRLRFLPKPFPADLALRVVREALDTAALPANPPEN